MAKIPDPTAAVSARAPRVRGRVVGFDPGISSRATTELAQEKQRAGIATQELGQQIVRTGAAVGRAIDAARERKARRQLSAAKNAFLKSKVEWDAAFNNDPDYDTYTTRYVEGVEKSRDGLASTIEDPETQQMFSEFADVDIARGRVAMDTRSWIKEKDTGRAALNAQLQDLQETVSRATDNGTRTSVIDTGNGIIISAEASEYVTAQEAEKIQKDFVAQYALNRLLGLPEEEQERLLREAKKDSKTWVSFIPVATRVKMLARSQEVNKESDARQAAQDKWDTIRLKNDNYADRKAAAEQIKDTDERQRVLKMNDAEDARIAKIKVQKYDEIVQLAMLTIKEGGNTSDIAPATWVEIRKNGDEGYMQDLFDFRNGLKPRDRNKAMEFYDFVARNRFKSPGAILQWSWPELAARVPEELQGKVLGWREEAAKAKAEGNAPKVDKIEAAFNNILTAAAADLGILGTGTGVKLKRALLRIEMERRREEFQRATGRTSVHSDWLEMQEGITKEITLTGDSWWERISGAEWPDAKPLFEITAEDIDRIIVPDADRAEILKDWRIDNGDEPMPERRLKEVWFRVQRRNR